MNVPSSFTRVKIDDDTVRSVTEPLVLCSRVRKSSRGERRAATHVRDAEPARKVVVAIYVPLGTGDGCSVSLDGVEKRRGTFSSA